MFLKISLGGSKEEDNLEGLLGEERYFRNINKLNIGIEMGNQKVWMVNRKQAPEGGTLAICSGAVEGISPE